LVACGKYIVVNERAHSKMINCIKITEILTDKVVIITSSEDECVKIWDTKFNLISEFNLRKTGFFEGIAASRVLFILINFRICLRNQLIYFHVERLNVMVRRINRRRMNRIKMYRLC
jgi:hypothetical protein